jgi:UDPglucose 6-dehydrogenase
MALSVAVIGCGYVGLVAGTCLASLGHRVRCHDHDPARIAHLLGGGLPILEPDLADLIARSRGTGRLTFETDCGAAVRQADLVLVAVGTPSVQGSDEADLSAVESAVRSVARAARRPVSIVLKSTVPVGTNRRMTALARQVARPGVPIAVASNPEFLRQGSAVVDFLNPDRIVIGTDDPRTAVLMRALYAPLAPRTRIVVTDPESAELVKYAANSFLAIKVGFINEIADLCEAVGADIEDVAYGVGLDPRIGSAFLRPGPGWGGSCFPKDSRALLAAGRARDVDLRITDAAILANTARKALMARRIQKACGGSLRGKRIAIFGLTFKGQTDDLRDSPALDILPLLVAAGAQIAAHDPAASRREVARVLPGVVCHDWPEHAARGAHALVVLADWHVFRSYDWSSLAQAMADPVMIDLRNLMDVECLRASGFRHLVRVGRSDRCFAARPLEDRRPKVEADAAAPRL